MAVLGVSVFALPRFGAPSWAAIGLVSAGAVAVGAHRHGGSRPVAWWLFAAAILAMAAGDTIYGATAHSGPDAVPAIADVCYLAMFPLITAGMITMVRTGAGLTDWSRWLDVLTFTCAAALLAWVFLTAPAMATGQLSSAEKSMLAAYNLGDLLILATTVRLVFAARRGAALLLLAVGATALLAADISYTLDQLGGGWRPGGPADAAYLVFYASWGAAALQPSMVRIVAPTSARDSSLQARWAALLGLSLTIPPLILIGEAMTGQVRDAPVIGIVSGLMSTLVVTRLVNALGQQRRALARERALRHASGALLSALTPHGVDAAIHEAVSALLPPNEPHTVIVALRGVDDPETLDEVAPQPALVRVLSMDPQADADAGLGVLLVRADRKVLAAIEDSVEVLAAQATLALDRMALTDQINRRDSEHYLRTITHNSVDMVLIVDDNFGIRYASTSVATTFGLDLSLPATLRDLEPTGDGGQITRTLATARRWAQPEGTRDWWYLQRSDGSPLTLEVNCRDLRQDQTVRGYVITMRDTSLDRGDRELIQQALDRSPDRRR